MEDVQSFRLSNCKIDIAIKCRVTRRRVPCCHTAPPGSASGIILPINSWNCFHGFHGSSIDVQELWSKSLGWPSRRDCFYASPWASLACLVLPDTNTITLVDVITHLAFPCPSVITGFRTARSAAVFSSLIPFFFFVLQIRVLVLHVDTAFQGGGKGWQDWGLEICTHQLISV